MDEVVITSGKMNHLVDPVLHAWSWQIPVYLFLGGLVAGIAVLSALMVLMGKNKEMVTVSSRIPVLAPIFLSMGMLALFLDLELKLHVYKMYFTFKPSAPMSWGAWILVLFYPFNLMFVLNQLKEGFPEVYEKYIVKKIPVIENVIEWLSKYARPIAWMNVIIGSSLGIYTGILLGAFAARPFWNSAILGPLFLVSGLSAAAALVVILSSNKEEIRLFQRIDLGLIITELVFLGLLIIELVSGPQITRQAVALILGGELTVFFWIFVILIGLIIPMMIELAEMKGKHIPVFISPTMVLIGGILLRFVIVEAGQISTWIPY